jgi:hypothetical protein
MRQTSTLQAERAEIWGPTARKDCGKANRKKGVIALVNEGICPRISVSNRRMRQERKADKSQIRAGISTLRRLALCPRPIRKMRFALPFAQSNVVHPWPQLLAGEDRRAGLAPPPGAHAWAQRNFKFPLVQHLLRAWRHGLSTSGCGRRASAKAINPTHVYFVECARPGWSKPLSASAVSSENSCVNPDAAVVVLAIVIGSPAVIQHMASSAAPLVIADDRAKKAGLLKPI